MDFGYFTLSDNYYPHNPRTASDFVLEIRDQAILADHLGFHSAWIGEHHFDRLGVNSRPDLLLASIIPETRHLRLAPAVTVLPLHHPLHVAECWATLDLLSGGRVDFATGRGYDREEYAPFGVSFMESQERFAEGIDVVLKAWTEPGVWSHRGNTTTSRPWRSRRSRSSSRCPSTLPVSLGRVWRWRQGVASTLSSRRSRRP